MMTSLLILLLCLPDIVPVTPPGDLDEGFIVTDLPDESFTGCAENPTIGGYDETSIRVLEMPRLDDDATTYRPEMTVGEWRDPPKTGIWQLFGRRDPTQKQPPVPDESISVPTSEPAILITLVVAVLLFLFFGRPRRRNLTPVDS